MELAVEWIRQSQKRRIWARLRNSEVLFCAVLAAFLVLTRIIAFDGRAFFSLQHVPNHDMLAGFPFFATNLHAYRTTGDIAWWNPVSQHGMGYAQYYQSFLSPVAPSTSHILFVTWMQGNKVLSWFGITIPEYKQYLVFTYILSPFVAFFFFNLFLCRLFRNRWAILLAATAFAFSTVGLWLSAFLYFQETGTLFFLLAAWLGVLQRPTFSRALLLLAAIIVQFSSINYWTVFNSWFLLLMVGGHAALHHHQVARAGRRAWGWIRQHRLGAVGLTLGFISILSLWLCVTGTMVHEQKDLNVRVGRWYSIEEVRKRLEDTRWFTVEPFNPKLERATASYGISLYGTVIPMHCARYIGVAFLPLLVMVPFYRWRRKERWLVTVAVGVFCISLASPWFLQLWKWTPGMDHIFHFFYVYPQYLMLTLILLGAAAFEKLLGSIPNPTRRFLHWVTVATITSSFLVLLGVGVISDKFPAGSSSFEGLTRFGSLFLISALLVAQLVRRPQWRALPAGLLVFVAFSDLTRYFVEVNRADQDFTPSVYPGIEIPLPPKAQADLRRSWPPGDADQGFSGGLENASPLQFDLWPNNTFLRPFHLQEVWAMPDGQEALKLPMREVRFVQAGPTDEFTEELTGRNLFDRLLIHDRATGTLQTPRDSKFAEVPFHFTRWRYNEFSIDVDCPTSGWVFLRLLFDPRWRMRVDGLAVNPSRANWMCMAFEASAGKHHVELEYRPRARRYFWPACWLTEAALLGLMIMVWRNRLRRSTREQ